jgi:D-proline reductase (dithiol) PrdB
VIVDSFKFLPRSFRPLYEGRGPFEGEAAPVWTPFQKRLAESRIALLTSAGIYLRRSQPSFDLEGEQTHPDWGDPSWRAIPAWTQAADLGVAHLHINDEDLLADPEIALPMRLLARLASQRRGNSGLVEGLIGSAVTEHVSVMGYQDRALRDWRTTTAPQLVAHLQGQGADGLILAPV